MNICPNINLTEWKQLEKSVGRFEALRDFMEHNGEIRTPQEVEYKIALRSQLELPFGGLGEGMREAKVREGVEALDKVVTQLEFTQKANLINSLKKSGILSKRAWKDTTEGNKIILTIPKISTEKSSAKNTARDRSSFSGEKNVGAWDELQSILDQEEYTNRDTSFVELKETPNAYLVIVPKDIYNYSLKNKDVYSMYNRDTLTGLGLNINDIDTKNLNYISTDNTQAIEIATKLAEELSNQLGVKYQFVTSQQASEITSSAKNPWNGESAFYIGDIVYFVGTNLTSEKVLHEFSHPLVRAISISNPVLFEKLYNTLQGTPEGQAIIQQVNKLYPEFNPHEVESEVKPFMEEVIVRALASAAQTNLLGEANPKSFAKVISDILYSIKQLLRKVFGQSIDISKLNCNTKIDDLAKMLEAGDKFKIYTNQVSQEDTVAYVRDQQDYIDDMMKVSTSEIQAITNRGFDIATKHIDVVLKNKNYSEMVNILADEFNRGDLQEIKKNLSAYKTDLSGKMERLGSDIEYTKNQVSALVNTLFRLQSMAEKIRLHMEDISKSPESIDNLHKAYYYDYLLKYWKQFIDETKDHLDKNNIDTNSQLSKLVSTIDRSIDRSKKLTNSMYTTGVKDILYQEMKPMADSMESKYNNIISNLKKKNAPQHIIDKWQKEYDSVKITPDKMEKLLKGELGDANAFNSFFEGYLYNTDPVVGGFAVFVKNNMNEVLSKAHAKFNDFSTEMKPLLEAAGYNPSNIGELGKKIGFIDKIGRRDDDGNLTEKKIWTLLNPFKDYRYKIDSDRHNVQEAQRKFSETGSDEDRQSVINLIGDQKKHLRDYFNQEYLPEFYERQGLLEHDDIGKEAGYERERIFEEMRLLSEPATSEMDVFQISDKIDALWREYRQLHSLLDLNGNKKTGKDYEIAQRLRQYRDESRKFYEFKERSGVFQSALVSFEQELVDKGIEKDSDQFDILRKEWLKKNTRVVIKDEFYNRRNDIFNRIQEITSRLSTTNKTKVDVTDAWQDILDAVSGFRDDDGQPIASDMSEGRIALVKKRQEEINKMQEELAGLSGLTKLEMIDLSNFFDQMKAGEKLTKEERKRFNDLMSKKDTLGLNKIEKTELYSLFEELKELQRKESTEYYLDIMNNWLSKLDTEKLFASTGSRIITKSSSDAILDKSIIGDLLSQNEEFAIWFKKNHIEKTIYNKVAQQEEQKWERLYIWNIIRPNNPDFLEKTDIKDQSGETIEQVIGLPALKYSARVVKSEYRTQKVIGMTVDNRGQWLPKTREQGAIDDTYRNEDYFNLQKNDPKMFNVLSKLTENHLKNQEGLGHRSRLYLDMPRFRKSALETFQTTNVAKEKMSTITLAMKRIRDFFRRSKDAQESGFNATDEFNLVRADMFDDEISSIPIAGLYDLDLDEVSTDITESMMRYMLSAERQKKLVEINPVAQALRSVVNDPDNKIKQMDKVNQFNFVHRGVTTYLNKKGKSVRQTAVNNFIEREFEGQTQTGFAKDTAWVNNTATLLFKRSSFGFFALNIPSALKNSFSAKFQGMIEAAAGKYMSPHSFTKGEGWAFNTMGKISFELYNKGPKSLDIQIVELFDPAQGRFEEKFGESISRTTAKDVASMSWLYNFRKWTELQATLQTFAGMMYHKKVDMGGKEVTLMDIWEVKDGKIQLKPGVDPKYGVTYDAEGNQILGSEFKKIKNEIHVVMNSLNGAYSKFDQPEAQRYIAFRFLSYLRRYFTTMAVNRWGFSGSVKNPMARLNPGLGDTSEGWYVTFLKSMTRIISSGGQYMKYMTQDEKRAFIRVTSEVGSLVALNALMPLLFGWDPDDDDRFKKLRDKSGPLPFPFVADSEPDFQLGGFMENHALMLMMNIRSENEQFLPFPGMGLDDYSSMTDMKSIAFGPTTDTYKQILEDLTGMANGSDKAYYKRRVGPYEWQQQESAKVWAHMAKTFGITGSSIDPATAIKNFQSVQARAK